MDISSDNPEHGFQFPGVFEITAMGPAGAGLEAEIPRLLVAAHPTWGVDVGAAALIHRPIALILDEPFSGLDPDAVDEKMWADEPEKPKQGDSEVQGETQDDREQAGELRDRKSVV